MLSNYAITLWFISWNEERVNFFPLQTIFSPVRGTLKDIDKSYEQVDHGLSKHQEVSSTPMTKVKNMIGIFMGPWCNKKVNPKIYVTCGSYELLLSNVAHRMKEKLTIQNKFSNF